ncbi:MAG: hypothetical protein J1F10_03740 [Muribaculaceae bacterium]|nr:hypothetical protein [Muribaculaceae bacterium]
MDNEKCDASPHTIFRIIDRRVKIEPPFDPTPGADSFSEGLAEVECDGESLVIDKNGNVGGDVEDEDFEGY